MASGQGVDGLFAQEDATFRDLFKKSQQEQKDELDDEDREMLRIIEEGGLDLRSKWGLRFQRAAAGGKSEEYTGTRQERAQFRQDWIKAKFQKKQEIREKRTSYRRVDFKRGVYRPFSIIYKNQGGADDPGAYKAAINICMACCSMGGDWVRENKMSGRMEYFELEQGWARDFTEAWSLYERRSQENGGDDGDGAEQSGQEPQAKPKAKGKSNAGGTPREKDPGQKDTKRTKTSLETCLTEASGLRKEYASTMLVAQEIQKKVDKQPGFEWAATDMAKLTALINAVDASVSPFGSKFLTADIKDVKKEYKDRNQILEQELNQFIKDVKGPMNEVSKHTKLINGTIMARNALS